MGVEFIPMDPKERDRLRESLRKNVESSEPVRIGKDTSFASADASDEEVVFHIKSVPVHY